MGRLAKKIFLIFVPLALVVAFFVLAVSAKDFIETQGCLCEGYEEATGEFIAGEKQAFFASKEIFPLLSPLPEVSFDEWSVLGEKKGEEKWIEISLSEQKLWAWEQDNLFLESLISSGKWSRTPTGEFRVWIKFKYAKMSGGSRILGNYYYLPNVPYIMYFYNRQVPAQRGYALHGTYWHNNFGQPMSHGCINLPTPVAEKLFYWTEPIVGLGSKTVRVTFDSQGTKIVIRD